MNWVLKTHEEFIDNLKLDEKKKDIEEKVNDPNMNVKEKEKLTEKIKWIEKAIQRRAVGHAKFIN